jgi:hypothetical protein
LRELTIVRRSHLPTGRSFEPVLETVETLLTQKEADFEIAVVDQNSFWPEVLRTCKQRVASDARVKWLFRDKPGAVAAGHDAVEVANWRYLGFH